MHIAFALVLAAALQASQAEAPVARRSPAPTPAPPLILEGIVKGPDGKAVENALVVALALSRGIDEPPLTARSDAQGRFRLELKRPGTLTVQVQAKGLAAWNGEKVSPGTPLAVSLAKGLAVEGVVRDGNSGTPVPNARVAATIGMPLTWEPEAGIVSAVTDGKGRYRLEGLPRGVFELSARAPGYGRAQRRNVRAGGTADFLVFPGASLYGIVLGPDGKPVAEAVVRAEAEERWSRGVVSERTDGAGRFELLGIEPGSYTLIARHPDFAPGLTTGVLVERGVDARADIALTRGSVVTGRLLGADDTPLAGRVIVQELNGRAAGRDVAELLRSEAGADGRFRLDKVPTGFHALNAVGPGFAPTRVDFDIGARAANVDLGDVLLETGLAIRGRVSDRAGAAVADASITAHMRQPRAGGSRAEARSGPDGRFVLAGLSQARYTLWVGSAGYGGVQRTVQAGDESVEFVLDRAGAVSGAVVDEEGRPVESYEVSAEPLNDDGSSLGKWVNGTDGRFQLEDLAPGTYVLQVSAPDKAPAARSDVVVAPGGTVDVGRIRLVKGGVVRGTVTDSQGAAVPGASVSVQRAARDYSGWNAPEGISDASGAFEVPGVLEGTAIAVVRHPEYAEGQSAPFVVDAKGTAEAHVVLTRGGHIEGSARKRDGSPVGPAVVHVSQPGSRVNNEPASLRPDGTFSIEHVAPGHTLLSLMQGSGGRFSASQRRETEVREGETSVVEFVQRDILVSGHVRRSGSPAPGMRVMLRGRGGWSSYAGGALPPGASAPSGPQRLTAITRDDGSYELLADEPGRIRVLVESADGSVSLPSRFVDIPDADTFLLDLDFSGVTVSGLVADKQTGQPVAEATVHAVARKSEGSAGPPRAVSGPDGRFQLDLEQGEYRLNASADGYAAVGKEIRVPGSGDVVLALSRGALLKGKVVDTAGRGVSSLDVSTFSGNPDDWAGQSWAYTLPDGSFQFEPLLRRPYNVFAGHAAVGFGLAAGAVPGEALLTLVLRPPGRVQLLVRGSDGAPSAGAYARVVQVDGAKIMSMLQNPATDAQGIAELVLPAGRVQLTVWKDEAEGSVTIDVPEGGSASAEVTLAPAPPGGAP